LIDNVNFVYSDGVYKLDQILSSERKQQTCWFKSWTM